ncbi:MAG: CGNR zinc finger domain-containing protein [Acidimicrobiia bacterium]
MDALPLESAGYEGTYKLVGGQSSLDLVNTLAWRGRDREHEWLDRPSNVTLWASEIGIIDEEERRRLDEASNRSPDGGRSDLERVHQIRQVIGDSLSPLARGNRPPPVAVDRLNSLLEAVSRRRRIDPTTLRWSWLSPMTLEDLMAPVIWNAGEVLTGVEPERLGHCPSCDWLFHDTTRNRSRRWCDMADCGSRDKALRYYHRHKTA